MLSFIVPAHNEEAELPATLRAIHAAAQEGKHSYEIVVVDDASTDATAAIAGEFAARLVRIDLRHIAAARNAGAKSAAGEILFFVDADTRIAAAHISGALAALEGGYAGGSARVKLDRAIPIGPKIFLVAFSSLYFALNLGVGAFIFTRRATFEIVGGFDEQYFAGEEAYLSMALKKRGPLKILREPIVTSARKISLHSSSFVLAQLLFIFFGGKRALRERQKLDLWYDGKREGKPALARDSCPSARTLRADRHTPSAAELARYYP